MAWHTRLLCEAAVTSQTTSWKRTTEVSEQEPTPDIRSQIDEMLLNARNEMIVQAANAYLFGQQAMRLGLGAAAMGKDELAEIATRMIERGEIAESDIQQNVHALLEQIQKHAVESDAVREEFTQKATVALKANVRTLLELLRLPGGTTIDEIVSRKPDEPAPGKDK